MPKRFSRSSSAGLVCSDVASSGSTAAVRRGRAVVALSFMDLHSLLPPSAFIGSGGGWIVMEDWERAVKLPFGNANTRSENRTECRELGIDEPLRISRFHCCGISNGQIERKTCPLLIQEERPGSELG